MSYLADKHARFLASLEKPPIMPIQFSPSDLKELASHFEKVGEAFAEYVSNIAREAHACGLIDIDPEATADHVRDGIHDCNLAQMIRSEAENIVERALEDA